MNPKQTCSTVMTHGTTVVRVMEQGAVFLKGDPQDSGTALTNGSLVDKVERHCEDDEKLRVAMKSC